MHALMATSLEILFNRINRQSLEKSPASWFYECETPCNATILHLRYRLNGVRDGSFATKDTLEFDEDKVS